MKVVKLEAELRRAVRNLKDMKKVEAVYLFGSYATGRQLPFSDIDVCVIGRSLSVAERNKIASFGSEKVQISIFDELPIYIKFRVLKDGRLLFCRNDSYLHDTKFSTLKEYFDFWPLLKRFETAYLVKK